MNKINKFWRKKSENPYKIEKKVLVQSVKYQWYSVSWSNQKKYQKHQPKLEQSKVSKSFKLICNLFVTKTDYIPLFDYAWIIGVFASFMTISIIVGIISK